jgi:maltose 6'-phosphate phosphatase
MIVSDVAGFFLPILLICSRLNPMSALKLLYASNIISRLKGRPQQELAFAVLVDNRAYDKWVTVHWGGEDGVWHGLPASYLYGCGENLELWVAKVQVAGLDEEPLPGNVMFWVEGGVGGENFTDTNFGQNYLVQADAGVMVPDPEIPLVVVDHQPALLARQRQITLTAVVNRLPHVRRVLVHYTTNNWHTTHERTLEMRRNYWDKATVSNARNPNQYGTAVWTTRLNIGEAYRVQYAIGCELQDGRLIWVNNYGANYTAVRGRLRVLTLNLHCYQEADQQQKFRQIAHAIKEQEIDVVCLQEVGENWNNGHGDWASNAARIINDHLPHSYHLYTDWSHLGFDRFREGVAILSRYPFRQQAARYVSHSQDAYNIHARKVVMAQIDIPYFGKVNVFSAHLSWWHDGFAHQFEALRSWANQLHHGRVAATLLCGDFNIKAGSDGYAQVVQTQEYDDQYLKIVDRPIFDAVFRQPVPHWRNLLAHDGRIDYIWQKRHGTLKAVAARELFTEHVYGRVSDHLGYFVEFELY